MTEIYKVGVLGGGTMGSGIALVVARAEIPVVVKELPELVEKVKEKLVERIDSWVQRGKITPEQAEAKKELIEVTSDLNDLADVDLIIEAVPENMEFKKKIFSELDEIVKDTTIFASNTSALSITKMAEVTKRPDKVVGMHFFNPPTTMLLIEIIKGERTSEETILAIEDFSLALQKSTIRVKECPGFLVNRLLCAYLNEAVLALEYGKFSLKDLDAKAREFGWPMGPFTLTDLLGIDVAAEVLKILYQGYGERMAAPRTMPLLIRFGRLGQKSGAGFYVYDNEKGFEDFEDILEKEFGQREGVDVNDVFYRMMIQMANEGARALEEEISSAEDIERGCILGLGFPQTKEGPLHWADSFGLKKIVGDLRGLEATYGIRYQPSELLIKYAEENKTFFESW